MSKPSPISLTTHHAKHQNSNTPKCLEGNFYCRGGLGGLDHDGVEPVTEVRLDKWLWAVRAFKTRSLATAACRAGHVKLNGQPVKPAAVVRAGMVFSVQVGVVTRTLKVAALLERRVGAGVVAQYMEDLTPPEEYAKRHDAEQQPLLQFPKGAGRPTKKQRRLIHPFLKD